MPSINRCRTESSGDLQRPMFPPGIFHNRYLVSSPALSLALLRDAHLVERPCLTPLSQSPAQLIFFRFQR